MTALGPGVEPRCHPSGQRQAPPAQGHPDPEGNADMSGPTTTELIAKLHATLRDIRYGRAERAILDRARQQCRDHRKPETIVRGLRAGRAELAAIEAGDAGLVSWTVTLDVLAWAILVVGLIKATSDLPMTTALGVIVCIVGIVSWLVYRPRTDEELAASLDLWRDERPERDGGWTFCAADSCPRPAARDGFCLRHLPRPVYDQEAS